MRVAPGVRGLIFDCDGTLADTMPIHWTAWRETFAAFGQNCPQAFLDRHKGIPALGIVERYNAAFGQNIDARRFAAEKNQRAFDGLRRARPIAPVVAIVRQYRGRLPMAVASGGTRANVVATLAAIGLEAVFDTILTADDAVAPKPDPAIFLEAARRLKVAPAVCQVFEDGDPGIEAAQRAGMIATDVRRWLECNRHGRPPQARPRRYGSKTDEKA